jgi:hypothetical protein
MYPQLQFQHHERTLGLMDSAQQPQLPGRLLQVSDIKPDLQVGGRVAAEFSPNKLVSKTLYIDVYAYVRHQARPAGGRQGCS